VDCADPWRRINWYGETDGFERQCGRRVCPGFLAAFTNYATAHNAATRQAHAPEGNDKARVLVIRDRWKNVGMGFMPEHVASIVRFAVQASVYVYFENYGRYDWTRYFYGYLGLDVRWTEARSAAWQRKFASVGGAVERNVEVWHDEERVGDEEWEQTVTQLLSNRSVQLIRVHGQATTFHFGRVLAPALARLVKPHAILRDAHGQCTPCATWAMFRPRPVLLRALVGTPVTTSTPLVCLKGRTMYAEDKRFLPDDTPPTLAAIDELWLSYSDALQMGDETYWGPRPRLRCGNRLVPPGEALRCMQKLRGLLGPRARLFVAVDAPVLQQAAAAAAEGRAFVTAGVGVDPTNEYRDAQQLQLRGQETGRQDLAERNLIKVSLDYYLQGFCVAALTLRPSAFYNAANRRTSAVLPSIWRHLRANISSTEGFLGRAVCGLAMGDFVGLGRCMWSACGLQGCNNRQ